ncbi:MAG TPA: EVE domain-containing protein [Candidatus Rifleibacterium sp.]|nr:EVE domain-containing protein [Candidatus Rifleibacterium sp.]
MNYWLICLPREDMDHCMKIGTFGATRRIGVAKARKGDKVVCYVSKECKIVGLGELTSDYYMSDEKVFRADDVFPDRFNFKAEKLGSEKEIEIRSLINDLGFITNKAYWSVFFRLSNRQLPEKDYLLIARRCGRKA